MEQNTSKTEGGFFGDGIFEWQFPTRDQAKRWNTYTYNEDKYWGDFPRDAEIEEDLFRRAPWAIGPFAKHPGNPVLAPSADAWDMGRYDGGVHNGGILVQNNRFYYIYRGERPIDIPIQNKIDYICDIGLAHSDDGIHFTKDAAHSPFFRKGEDRRYSYEDVNIVRHSGVYYLFCNQWDWDRLHDYRVSGTFLATSKDLIHWEKRGIVFPEAQKTHRNGVVLQNPRNEAVAVDGKFIMYINDGLIAYSDDLIHWESHEVKQHWPGGEGCFAVTDYSRENPDHIVLFTGGHHTGHFYAIGEVLFSKSDPERPLAWLPGPVLHAENPYPWEDGRSVEPPHKPISSFRDCIFFNGLTQHSGKWWLYYGGSEYYTCLATAPVRTL